MPIAFESVPETVRPSNRRAWSVLAADAFSCHVMCVFLLVGVIFKNLVKGIAEPDVWWCLRNAQYIFQHHALPVTDMYSSGAAGMPWIDHEWLAEIVYFQGFKMLGLQGLVVVYFLVKKKPLRLHLYRRILPRLSRRRRLQECYACHAAGHPSEVLSRSVLAPTVVWLALYGGAFARAGSFSTNRQGSLGFATAVCTVDQLSRLLGLWISGARDRDHV